MKKQKKYIMIFVIIAIITTAAVSTAIYQKFNAINSQTSFYAGQEKISQTEYNFYHTMLINGFCVMYENSLSKFNLDISKDLAEQNCMFSEYETWADYFDDITKKTISQHKALCNDAEQNNYSYNAKDDWEEFYKQIILKAEENNLSLSKTISMLYGNGASESSIKKLFIQYATANSYQTYLRNQMEVTDEEIEKAIADNPNAYETATYLEYDIFADVNENSTEEQIKTEMDAAQIEAKDFFDSVYDEDTFLDLAKKDSGNNEIEVLNSDVLYEDISNTIRDWIFQCEEYGQMVYIKDEQNSCYRIIYFIKRERDESPTATIRQILVTPTSSLGTYLPSEEDYEKALANAKKIEEEYNNSEKTEESFANIAKEKSADIGTADFGGLMTSIKNGQYDQEMNDWIFDNRESGDVGIVKTSYGYHIIYFVEYTDPIWKNTIAINLKQNKVDNYLAEITKNYAIAIP